MTTGMLFCIVNAEIHRQRKEHAMSTTTSTYYKVIQNRHILAIGLIIILGIAITTGFVWMQTDHVIAPPGLRVLNWLWRVFVCQCPV